MTTASPSAKNDLRRSMLVAFTLPTLVLGIMHGPEGQMQAIYAKHAGITLGALAAATLLSKMFDAITYPLIGYLSDRSFARSGTRKSWIIAGTVVSVLGIWMLMRPPQGVDAYYFGLWMATTYLGWKLMEIPLQAWSYGLSADYVQRSRVQAWRALSQIAGTMLFFVIPFLAVKLGYSDSTELDFRSLALSAVICAIALPLATLLMVARVHNGVVAPPTTPKRPSLHEIYKAVGNNGHLLRLIAAFAPVNFFGGMSGGVIYLYMDTYLHLSKQFPAIMAVSLLASVFGIPFWTAMAARYERHRVWATGLTAGGIAFAGLAFLTPGPMALPLSFILYPIVMLAISGAVIVYTMSADIVDYGRQMTGEDHAGLYGSVFSFLQKSLLGVAAATGLALVGYFGFDATGATQTANGILGIKLVATILPSIGLLMSAAIIWNYSLTRARVEEIQAQLQLNGAVKAD